MLVGHFPICDRWRGAQPIVGRAIPGLVVLGSIRKQAECATRSKQATPPWLLHQLFLQCSALFAFLS